MAKKTARGRKQDQARVAGKQDYEVKYEAKKTGKSKAKVKRAVKKAGPSRKRVERALADTSALAGKAPVLGTRASRIPHEDQRDFQRDASNKPGTPPRCSRNCLERIPNKRNFRSDLAAKTRSS